MSEFQASQSDLIPVVGSCDHRFTVPEYVLRKFHYHTCPTCNTSVTVEDDDAPRWLKLDPDTYRGGGVMRRRRRRV